MIDPGGARADGSILSFLTLPPQITEFERAYLARLNRVALFLFALHVPTIMLVAAVAGTGVPRAGLLTGFIALGPFLACRSFDNPRHIARVFGVTAMCMGGVLVHFGQGPMQIEMHFYFFVVLALLAVFADPAVILLSAATITAHHVILFFVLPASVFNYEASFWAVAVHALFVVIESIAACFVARSFFDNVIGLEKIVGARTELLATRSRQLRTLLDSAGQGFLAFGRDGKISQERSAILTRWFGECEPELPIWSYLARSDPNAGLFFEIGWDSLIEGVFPMDVALDQMPRRVSAGGRIFELAYHSLLGSSSSYAMMLVVSDVTSEMEAEHREAENRELLAIFQRAMKDRGGFLELMNEGAELVHAVTDAGSPLSLVRRALHTLKGNCGLFGVTTIATLCHEIEDRIADGGGLQASDAAALKEAWKLLGEKAKVIPGEATRKLEIDEAEYASLVGRVTRGASKGEILHVLEGWKLEATEGRLSRLGEQATALAVRLHKDISVQIESSDVRTGRASLAPLWTSLVHVIRNAVDHGIETPEERLSAGKPAKGQLTLRTSFEGSELVFSVDDDGRGVDWEEVRSSAAKKGLSAETSKDLSDALFAEDFSTRDAVTEISGRGVGLSAVRVACEEIGGRVCLTSEKGRSTHLEIRVPKSRLREAEAVSIRPVVPRCV